MCGLAFLFDSTLTEQNSIERMVEAMRRMRHRGPDADGMWYGSGATIGHVRLSILDVGGSKQPMLSPNGRHVLAFNGEIYNFQDLRAELQQRWDFRTKGDTEVLLAGLLLQGEQFISRLEGMWAFVLWDSVEKSALFCRDRTGKKPIFYSLSGNKFACGSELPSLQAVWGEPWREDLNTTADYFRFGYPLPGKTFYENVFELKPATIGRWRLGEGVSTSPYWKPHIQKFKGTYQDAQESLREAIDRSIKRRLVSDVEVGSFLSGGIDSSIVSALAAQKHGHHQLKTFTIGFREESYDEREYAREVANHIGVDHHEGVLEDWDSQKLKQLLLNNVGQPFQDSSLLPTAEVSKVARQYVKVALSGDGSDELFCGYQRYKARAILNAYRWMPDSLRNFARNLVHKIKEPDVHHSRSLIKKLHLFMDVMDRREAEQPYISPVFFSQRVYDELFPDLTSKGYEFQMPWASDYGLPDVKEMMLADSFVYLPQDIHTKVDRASMAYSLETRAPFMDTQVVELALSLPLGWGFSWRQNKKILADTYASLLPKQVWSRRKQGFGVPISSWFRGALGDQLEELICSTSGSEVFDSARALKLLDRHRSFDRDFGYRLWLLYVYLVWKTESPLLVR